MAIDERDAWQSYMSYAQHAEANSWSRFYNFLMFSSILALAWSTIYSQTTRPPLAGLVLVVMAIIGLAIASISILLGIRSRVWVSWYYTQAKEIETTQATGNAQVATRLLSARDAVKNAPEPIIPYKRFGSFTNLISATSAVAFLFFVMLLVSFCIAVK